MGDMPQQAKLRVALVEDDAGMAAAVERVLGLLEIRVEKFSSAEDLLSGLARLQAHCCIFDIHLPEMTGLELLHELRARGCELPVILITADDEPEIRAAAEREGAAAFFVKPFDSRAIASAIRSAVPAP
jgi:FixJ family two-component response regulator